MQLLYQCPHHMFDFSKASNTCALLAWEVAACTLLFHSKRWISSRYVFCFTFIAPFATYWHSIQNWLKCKNIQCWMGSWFCLELFKYLTFFIQNTINLHDVLVQWCCIAGCSSECTHITRTEMPCLQNRWETACTPHLMFLIPQQVIFRASFPINLSMHGLWV